MKHLCSVVSVVAALVLLGGCAASMEQGAGSEALLPEIDVVQVKENSEEALRLAQEAKLDIDVINTKLTEIDNKLISFQDDLSSVSPAKIEEIENPRCKEAPTQMLLNRISEEYIDPIREEGYESAELDTVHDATPIPAAIS